MTNLHKQFIHTKGSGIDIPFANIIRCICPILIATLSLSIFTLQSAAFS
jgi:hypothetical protein